MKMLPSLLSGGKPPSLYIDQSHPGRRDFCCIRLVSCLCPCLETRLVRRIGRSGAAPSAPCLSRVQSPIELVRDVTLGERGQVLRVRSLARVYHLVMLGSGATGLVLCQLWSLDISSSRSLCECQSCFGAFLNYRANDSTSAADR